MERREFIGATGLAALGAVATSASAVAAEGETHAKITAINWCGIRDKNEAGIHVETENGGGWVRLGDGAQDQRTWAALWAVKAAFVAGRNPNAMLVYKRLVQVAGDAGFEGVERVYILK